MTIQDLLQQAVYEERRKEKHREYEENDKVLRARQPDAKGNSEFEKHLDRTKLKLGPYSAKMAEHFVRKDQIGRLMKNQQAQELINVVKMEYFLFGCVEAHQKIKLLQYLEDLCEDIEHDLDPLQLQIEQLEGALRQETGVDRIAVQKELQRLRDVSLPIRERLQSYRTEIRKHEKQLIEIWRELIAWNFKEDEDYFTRQGVTNDHFTLPMETYWLPVRIPEMEERIQ